MSDPFDDEDFLNVNSSGRISSPPLPLSAFGESSGAAAADSTGAAAGSVSSGSSSSTKSKEKKKSKKSSKAAAESHAFDPDELDLLGAFGAPSSSSSSAGGAALSASSVDAVPVLKTFGSGGGGGSASKKSKSKSAAGGNDSAPRSSKIEASSADLLSEPVVDEAHSKASLDDFFGADDDDDDQTVGHAQGKIGGGYASVVGASPPVLSSGGGGSGSSKHPKSKKVSKKVATGGFAPVGAELDAPPGADDDPEEDLEADARSMAAREARMTADLDAGGSTKQSLKRWLLVMALLLLVSLVVWQTGLLNAPVVDDNGNAVDGTQVTDDSLGANDAAGKQPEAGGEGGLNSDHNLDVPSEQQPKQSGGSADSTYEEDEESGGSQDKPPSGGAPPADYSRPVNALPGPDPTTDTSSAETLNTVDQMEKRDETAILLDAAKAAAKRDKDDANQVVEADAGKADAAKDAARALEEEKKKQRAAASATGSAVSSRPAPTPFETAMAQLQLAQLRAGMDAISGLSNRTSMASSVTAADIARCTEKAKFEVTIDGLDTLSDQKLTPWAVHTLRIRRVQPPIKHVDPNAPQPEACIGDSFHVWLRRAPKYVSASDHTHPRASLLPALPGSKAGRMSRKRLDLFPLDLSEAMEGGYSRNIYSDAWSLSVDRVVPDSSQYFPVFLERVSLPSDELGPEREEMLGTFFVGDAGLYRLDVLWLGTLFEDHADPRFAETVESQENEVEPPTCPAGARALPRTPGVAIASQPSPRYFRVDPPAVQVQDGKAPSAQQQQDLKLGPLVPQLGDCTRGLRTGLGFFSGTQYRPLDCHVVNFDLVDSPAAKASVLHGFPGVEFETAKGPHSEQSFKPQRLEAGSCASLEQLVAAAPSGGAADLWVLFVGDSTMRGLFQDSVDLVLDEETVRVHAQDALRNVYDLPESNLRLEFVEWVLSSETALPLRGSNYASREEAGPDTYNVAPSGDATRVPDVVVFSSGMLDVSHFALADYETGLTRVLKGLATWISKRSAAAAAATAAASAAGDPTAAPPSMPRFVWVTPPAQIQFAAQGGLGNASPKKPQKGTGKRMRALDAGPAVPAKVPVPVATAAQTPLCPTGTYSRTSAAAYLSRQLIVSLAPFIAQVDMHALTSMRLDLGIDGRYEKLFAPPGGFVSRMTTQLLWTHLCALELEDPSASDALADPVRQLIAEEVAAEVEEVQLKVDAGESVANATREVAREHASATAAATGSNAGTADDDAEEPTEADVDKEAERITEASTRDAKRNNLSSTPKGNDAIVAALRALDKSKPPKCFLDLPRTAGSGAAVVQIKQDPSAAVLRPEKGTAPLCRMSSDDTWFADYVAKCTASLTPVVVSAETHASRRLLTAPVAAAAPPTAAAGALPANSKFLVYSCVDSESCSQAEGLADHLLQIVYGFLLAFVSDRTFVLDMPDTTALFSVPTTTPETLAAFRADFAAFKNGSGDATKVAENVEQILYFNFQSDAKPAAAATTAPVLPKKGGKRMKRMFAALPGSNTVHESSLVALATPHSATSAVPEAKILFHQFYAPRSAKGAFVDFAAGTGKGQVDPDPTTVDFDGVWRAHRYVVLSPPTLGGTKLMGLLWRNELIRTKLATVGLTPESSFGCLLNLLLRPTAAPLRLLNPALPVLLDPHAFVVGIQGTFNEGDLPPVPPAVSADVPIVSQPRGGSASRNHPPPPAPLDPLAVLRAREAKAQQIGLDLPLACATEIYQSWLNDTGASVTVDDSNKGSIVPATRKLRYFFLSSSRLLRSAMVRRETEAAIVLNVAVAGERGSEIEVENKARAELANDAATAAGHKESSAEPNPFSVLSPKASALLARERADQLEGAWIEWWAFALADHHVIPAGAAGTFGRSAALRALRVSPSSLSTSGDEATEAEAPHIWDGSRSIHASCSKPSDAFTTDELQADGGRWVQKPKPAPAPKQPGTTKLPALALTSTGATAKAAATSTASAAVSSATGAARPAAPSSLSAGPRVPNHALSYTARAREWI